MSMSDYVTGVQVDTAPQTVRYAEGEGWFTQGEVVVPQSLPIEALPKQSWDSYKPDFWWGILCYQQQPLRNQPYQWVPGGEGWSGAEGPMLYNPRSDAPGLPMRPVSRNAFQVFGMTAPTSAIYTGTPDPVEGVAPWLR